MSEFCAERHVVTFMSPFQKQLTYALWLLGCLSVTEGRAQQLFVEAFSGGGRTVYELRPYSDQPAWLVPVGARLGGGLEHAQIGIEYHQTVVPATFDIPDDLTFPTELVGREEYEQQYYGLFLRGNFSSLPAYRFGLILKGGVGYYTATIHRYALPDQTVRTTFAPDRRLGFNGGIGISSPIFQHLHWEIGYRFHYAERDPVLALGQERRIRASYHTFEVGLSGNFVFGNTEKRCRRVMSRFRHRR